LAQFGWKCGEQTFGKGLIDGSCGGFVLAGHGIPFSSSYGSWIGPSAKHSAMYLDIVGECSDNNNRPKSEERDVAEIA
jgi:hypothetical protein